MKVAAFSRAQIESGKAGFNPENTVVLRFYESVNSIRSEKDEIYDKYAGGYISLIRDLDFSDPENNITGYEDYLPEADVLAKSIFREFLRGRDIIFQCEDGIRISGAFATATIEIFRAFRDDIYGECTEGYNEFAYKKIYDMLASLKRDEYTIL